MAFISQEEKKEIAPLVKSICKKYGVKGTLSIRNNTTVVLSISSGQLDFIGNYNKVAGEFHRHEQFNPATDYFDVNVYWYHDHFDGKVRDFLSEVIPALKGQRWFDKSDLMTDYFHVKHYYDVQIGKWNKPYILQQ